MKKVTLTDLNGKEIEVYYADDKTAKETKHNDELNVKLEDWPTDKNWSEMTGGASDTELGDYSDPDHPLNKHDEGQMYNMNEQDVNENSAGGGAHGSSAQSFFLKGGKGEGDGKVWSSLTKSLLNKIKLQESEGQIKIDDTIPSDFVSTSDLHLESIYVVAGLGLTAKFAGSFVTTVPNGNKVLLQMKRHGTLFYLEEGQLMRATLIQVDSYLNEPF